MLFIVYVDYCYYIVFRYVTKYRGFEPNKMVAVTLLFEGTAQEVREQERNVYEIAAKYGGMKAGAVRYILF